MQRISHTLRDEVISEFEKLIQPPQRMTDVHNSIKRKGQLAQEKAAKARTSRTIKWFKQKSSRQPCDENRLHSKIKENPFLLATPGLYQGGLYLDSIINKMPLPSRLIPDFCYITVAKNVIKITLVELESSTKKLFKSDRINGDLFHSEARVGIDQVKQWQQRMAEPKALDEFMADLEPLFEKYPIVIFDRKNEILQSTTVEIDYLLVVGSEPVDSFFKQQSIDDLYAEHGIILMSYAMMIDHVRQQSHALNTLSYRNQRFECDTCNHPWKIVHKAPGVRMPDSHADLFYSIPDDDDPFCVHLAGLGGRRYRRRADLFGHPRVNRAIALRSKGLCEHPGCHTPIVDGLGIHGHFYPAYNVIMKDSDVENILKMDAVVMLCDKHGQKLLKRDWRPLSEGHHFNTGRHAAYSQEADQLARLLLKSKQKEDLHFFSKWMGTVTLKNKTEWVMADHALALVQVLPIATQRLFADLVIHHHAARNKRPLTVHPSHLSDNNICRLQGLGLITLSQQGDQWIVNQCVINDRIAQALMMRYGAFFDMAIRNLCRGDVLGLERLDVRLADVAKSA